jgi:hypothetical protein
MREPQIGIEPMTAWRDKHADAGNTVENQQLTNSGLSGNLPEPHPKRNTSGNTMATEDDDFVRLSDGRRRHEAIIDAMALDGWKRKGLRPYLKARRKEQIAEALAGFAADDPERPRKGDDLTHYSEWGLVLEALGGRVPDAWRILEEDEQHGWGHPVTVLELAEVVVTHMLPADKWGEYAYLWITGDSMEDIAVRIYGVDPFGTVHPIVADIGGYFDALVRSGALDEASAA